MTRDLTSVITSKSAVWVNQIIYSKNDNDNFDLADQLFYTVDFIMAFHQFW